MTAWRGTSPSARVIRIAVTAPRPQPTPRGLENKAGPDLAMMYRTAWCTDKPTHDWEDGSGDPFYPERAISLCNRRSLRASVIGPPVVAGQMRGGGGRGAVAADALAPG